MFTKSQLLENYKKIQVRPPEFLTESTYPAGIESGIVMYRGKTSDFENAMQFLCNAISYWDVEGQPYESWKSDWWLWVEYMLPQFLYRPIEKSVIGEQLVNVFGYASEEVNPNLPDERSAVAALLLVDEWNKTTVLVEYEADFVYASWHTTA
ncbi:hypothetical protein EON80_05000 [bacterium]|nr:MAG: hypothetical protein EON80_05000 [bacterium]